MFPYILILLAAVAGCGGSPVSESASVAGPTPPAAATPAPTNNNPNPSPTPARGWDLEGRGIPQFVTADYIDLEGVDRISYFRSGFGHSYHDDRETCRSMKHYYLPKRSVNAAAIRIFSPVNGTIHRVQQEWAGVQVRIEPDGYPDFNVILFHVNLDRDLREGSVLRAGQQIGTHIGDQTGSDVAISVGSTRGYALVSWFDAMTDEVFSRYPRRGLASRADAIITRERRDAAPLTCNGENFVGSDPLPAFTSFR